MSRDLELLDQIGALLLKYQESRGIQVVAFLDLDPEIDDCERDEENCWLEWDGNEFVAFECENCPSLSPEGAAEATREFRESLPVDTTDVDLDPEVFPLLP